MLLTFAQAWRLVIGAGGLGPVLVAAGGLVVVLAILLVFLMVLRNNGGARKMSSGLNYDPQQGPPGQPRAPASQPGRQAWGQEGGYGAPAGAPLSSGAQNGWGGQASAGRWNEPGGQASGGWAGQPGQPLGRDGASGGAWQDQGGWAPPPPGGQQSGWNAPAAPQGWNQPAQPAQPGGWNAPAAPGWNAPAATAPSGQDWGVPAFGAEAPAMGYGARPAGPPQRMGMLVVRQGKEPGRTFEMRKDRITIGRSRDSDIFLEDLAVSRLHTTVGRDASGRYIVHDENSANGTFVNGQRIAEHVLEEGDEIQVGQTVLAFVRR
ncbi:MAG: FHA domain-containing protein [Ktedonobacterales bacterium]|nr:FHA domain-containing protein [Ktedonobacterales bacterium]